MPAPANIVRQTPAIGGMFVPPITPELLAEYRAAAEKAPKPQIREAILKLAEAVEVFQQTPESKLPSTGKNLSGTAPIVPLEEAEIRRIWDYVPYAEDLAMYREKLFADLEKDVHERNTRLVEQWDQAMSQHVTAKHFSDVAEHRRIREALRSASAWEALGFLTAEQRAKLEYWQAKHKACDEEIRQVRRTKKYDAVPYPQLEPTPLSKAAYHLLNFVSQLEKDREPMTSDKLKL